VLYKKILIIFLGERCGGGELGIKPVSCTVFCSKKENKGKLKRSIEYDKIV
jgi:hypothetical protein